MSDISKILLTSDKLATIPTPSKEALKKAKEKNRKKIEELHRHKLKILEDRKREALRDNDIKKKYACTAVEIDEKTRYNIYKQIEEIDRKMQYIEKNTENWNVLKFFSEIEDPKFWEKAEKNGYSDQISKDSYYVKGLGFKVTQLKQLKEWLRLRDKKHELEKLV